MIMMMMMWLYKQINIEFIGGQIETFKQCFSISDS